jgi:hypothetical protein
MCSSSDSGDMNVVALVFGVFVVLWTVLGAAVLGGWVR